MPKGALFQKPPSKHTRPVFRIFHGWLFARLPNDVTFRDLPQRLGKKMFAVQPFVLPSALHEVSENVKGPLSPTVIFIVLETVILSADSSVSRTTTVLRSTGV